MYTDDTTYSEHGNTKNGENIQPFILTPMHVFKRKDLRDSEKWLFGIVLGLTSQRGYCFASNAYLCELTGYSQQTISSAISKLEEVGLFQVEYLPHLRGTERRIYAGATPTTTSVGYNSTCTQGTSTVVGGVQARLYRNKKNNKKIYKEDPPLPPLEGGTLEDPSTDKKVTHKKVKVNAREAFAAEVKKLLPPKFRNPVAYQALKDWLDYRFKEKKAPLKVPSRFVSQIVEKFATAEALRAAVSYSIGQGYTGLFPDKNSSSGGSQRTTGMKQSTAEAWNVIKSSLDFEDSCESSSRV